YSPGLLANQGRLRLVPGRDGEGDGDGAGVGEGDGDGVRLATSANLNGQHATRARAVAQPPAEVRSLPDRDGGSEQLERAGLERGRRGDLAVRGDGGEGDPL